jgi:flagellar basal-body rod modification protein FlgD
MPITSVDGSSTTTPTTNSTTPGSSSSSSSSNTGDAAKQDFLKLLVAQLQNQDPLKPMEGTEFVTQLAQFTSVEQQIIQSQKLDVIGTQMQGLASNEAATLVGKRVTIQGQSSLTFDGNLAASGSFTLNGAAQDVKVSIKDANGDVVRTMDLKNKSAGAVPVVWDGKGDGGNTEPAGQYSMDITATDASGAAVTTTQQVSGTVVQVDYDKGYPEVVLDNGVKAPLNELVSVGSDPTGTTGATTSSAVTANAAALLNGGANSGLTNSQIQAIHQLLGSIAAQQSATP